MLDERLDVQLTDEAATHYSVLDADMTQRVNEAIDILTLNPFFGSNITRLQGEYAGKYRYRVGSYRIVYVLDTQSRRCIITGIYHCGRAYRP